MIDYRGGGASSGALHNTGKSINVSKRTSGYPQNQTKIHSSDMKKVNKDILF